MQRRWGEVKDGECEEQQQKGRESNLGSEVGSEGRAEGEIDYLPIVNGDLASGLRLPRAAV